MTQTVLIASDHRGFSLKSRLASWLAAHGYVPSDLGPQSGERCDASDFAQKVVAGLKSGEAQVGVLICGTGQAMAMTANRYQHVRAALCSLPHVARLTREHNDANVLVLGADFMSDDVAEQCLEVFLTTQFLGGRYAERRDKLTALGGL